MVNCNELASVRHEELHHLDIINLSLSTLRLGHTYVKIQFRFFYDTQTTQKTLSQSVISCFASRTTQYIHISSHIYLHNDLVLLCHLWHPAFTLENSSPSTQSSSWAGGSWFQGLNTDALTTNFYTFFIDKVKQYKTKICVRLSTAIDERNVALMQSVPTSALTSILS